jgi:tRNA wybutosine-synthesizing protein 1
MLSEKDKAKLENAGFRIIGNHSAIKTCEWTRKALRGKNFCYKQKFYGIRSHRCLQFTPSLQFCTHKCLFCWRDTSITSSRWKGFVDNPKFILEEAIKKHREVLQGFKGNPEVEPKRFEEALNPNQIAISLAGEPTMYPKLPELIDETKKMKMTSFLVTNGTFPNMLKKILSHPPTQLYITLPAPDEKIYKKTCMPIIKNGWKRIGKSLSMLKEFRKKCKTVIRLTLVKDLNFIYPEKYAEIIEEANPEFVEVKSFMSVGFSRSRLPYSKMPLHEEIKRFSEEIEKHSNYKIVDEKKDSRVILLK